MTGPRGCPIQDGRRMKRMQVVFHFMYLIDKDAAIVHQTLLKFSAFFFNPFEAEKVFVSHISHNFSRTEKEPCFQIDITLYFGIYPVWF